MEADQRLRLFLLRHGQVAANREFRYVGDRDEPLTDEGRSQVVRLADALAALPAPPERLLSSPRRRTLETARAIAERLGVEVEVEGRLAEQSFGRWEGLTREEVRALGEQDARLLQLADRDPEVGPPGGEALAAVSARVLGLLGELWRQSEAGAQVALVSHVGPIKAVLAASLGVSLGAARRMFLDLATISVVDWGEPSVLRLFNGHSHLGWENARWLDHRRALPPSRSAGS